MVDDLLPRDLPARALLAAGHVLVGAGALALLVAGTVRFPQSATGKFVVVAEGGADPVRAPRAGALDAIAVTEGANVAAGATLFVLRSEDVALLATRVPRLEHDLADLDRLAKARDARHRAALESARASAAGLGAESR